MVQKKSYRSARIAELVQEEVAKLIQAKIFDPRLKEIVITGSETNSDLSRVYLYFLCPNKEQEHIRTLSTLLKNAAGFLRHELSLCSDLRYVPELVFRFDQQHAAAQRIDKLLAAVQDKGPSPEEKADVE